MALLVEDPTGLDVDRGQDDRDRRRPPRSRARSAARGTVGPHRCGSSLRSPAGGGQLRPASDPARAPRGSAAQPWAPAPGTGSPSAGGPPPRRNSADPWRDSWSGGLSVQESTDSPSRTFWSSLLAPVALSELPPSSPPERSSDARRANCSDRRRIQPIVTRTTTSSTATLLWTYLATGGPFPIGSTRKPVAARASIAPPARSSTCRPDQPGVREKPRARRRVPPRDRGSAHSGWGGVRPTDAAGVRQGSLVWNQSRKRACLGL